jgi:hypothetical protein
MPNQVILLHLIAAFKSFIAMNYFLNWRGNFGFYGADRFGAGIFLRPSWPQELRNGGGKFWEGSG